MLDRTIGSLSRTIQPRRWPEGHSISFEKAKQLVQGPLGQVYRAVALSCCAPLLWFRPSDNPCRILHNGTVTVVRTPKKIFGVTAAHVIEQYNQDFEKAWLRLQLKDKLIEGIRIIDSCSRRDLATIELDEQIVNTLGLEPLDWPSEPPGEGRGLLAAGYPGNGKMNVEPMQVDWTPFFAITTARTVTEEQITLLISRNEWVNNSLPERPDLGGISGGPIIGIFETKAGVAFHRLSGVITEHPNYETSDFCLERIVGSSAAAITDLGTIR